MTSSVTSRGGPNKTGNYGEYESLEELNSIAGGPMPTSYSGSALNRLLTEDEQYLSRKYFNHRRYPHFHSPSCLCMGGGVEEG